MFGPKKFAIFASGAGTTLQYILDQIPIHKLNITVNLVIADRPETGAEKIAIDNNIRSFVTKDDKEMAYYLEQNKIEYILLAGYLRKIGPHVLHKYEGNIINTHPSLLPKYGGKGMYGMNVHQAVFEAREKFSGVTIHYVNEKYDEGEIIVQNKISIEDCTSPKDVEFRVKDLEKKTLLEFLKKI